ncbi:TolC family protein [Mariprofundus erugo]|uniref:TolC family protein n=1 Tax=Mariprofundus erugo TaxID=2528639 RepID=A0A5R9GMY5_9PROT|nr:TolC family protein [Mariprofundus erugo]TLS67018.1 TolC family protein [Mariprofundus erugo]
MRSFTRLYLYRCAAWLLPVLAAAIQPAVAAEPLTLAAAEQLARDHNPSLAGAGVGVKAMQAIPAQAGALPDPVLRLGAMNLPLNSLSLSQEAMTQMQVGLSQKIPFPGKLDLQQSMAAYRADVAGFEYVEAGLKLVRDVRMTWWNLCYLDRALDIVRHNQVLLRQFVRIAEAKYKTGEGLQQDVLLAQVELSKLLDVEITLTGSRKSQAAWLNAQLGRRADHALILPATVNESLAKAPDEAWLLQKAKAARPALTAKAREVSAAADQVALAEKDYYPDFTLAGDYGFRQGRDPNGRVRPDMASIQLSFTLPVYSSHKQAKEVDQRLAEKARAAFALEDATRSVEAEALMALADYQRSSAQASLFKTGIIPQASQTVASMLSGFQVGKVDFLNLVGSQITLYNYETQYWKVLAEANQAYARLIAAAGGELHHE